MGGAKVSPFALLAALALTGFGLRLSNAWTELEALSFTTLPDQAFHYFAIAQNLGTGFSASIDKLHPTTGYSPLWIALLSAIYGFDWAHAARTPVHVALTLSGLFDVAAGFVLWRVLVRLGFGVWAQLVAIALFALNPFQVAFGTSGLDTPLALCAALGLLLLYLHYDARDTRPRTALWFGALGGGAVLVRADLALVFGVFLAAQAVRARRAGASRRELVYVAGTAGLALFAIVVPWLSYLALVSGSVVPDDAAAAALLAARVPRVWGFTEVPFWLELSRANGSLLEALTQIARLSGLALGGTLLGLGLTSWLLLQSRAEPRVRALLTGLAPFFVALLALLFVHAVVRGAFRPWDVVPFAAGIALVAALGTECVASFTRASRFAPLLAAVAALFTLVQHATWQSSGLYPKVSYRGLDPMPREGHTESGAVAYFSRGTVTNLDGSANHSALRALRSGKLLDYVAGQGIDRIYASDAYHTAAFMGARYREGLRRDPTDARAVQLVTEPGEKLKLIRLNKRGVLLGSLKGREYLSDGWRWASAPQPGDWASSVGDFSEVVFTPARRMHDDTRIELQLKTPAAGVLRQPVVALLDGRVAARFEVGATPSWYSVDTGAIEPRLYRLRLEYAAAHPLRQDAKSDWWRSPDGSPRVAVLAARFRLRGRPVRKPVQVPPPRATPKIGIR
jgi:hypothetical protein